MRQSSPTSLGKTMVFSPQGIQAIITAEGRTDAGSKPVRPNKIASAYTGAALTVFENKVDVKFTNDKKEVCYQETIELK